MCQWCNFKFCYIKNDQNFPTGSVDRNLPANAGDMGIDPWSRKISPAVGQLSP